jgi:hypothetical protein
MWNIQQHKIEESDLKGQVLKPQETVSNASNMTENQSAGILAKA